MMPQKQALRRRMLQLRRELDPVRKGEMDGAIARRLLNLPAFAQAQELLLYAATDIEVETREIFREAAAQGKRVYFPCCQVERHEMSFYHAASFGEMTVSHYGIPEPVADPAGQWTGQGRTLCIVPALALDHRGMRLGYGGGYYDRFLARHPELETIGLCYEAGLLDAVPTDVYDIPLGMILTESTLEVCDGGSSESI
ncbi:5-formyltetrahydrofolate cyclo-ligase [Ruminococcus sp.]|uniref:5-formyltetrahydrofolate cyclo-ligase n=1 Tax=Ruminococcus sp. TaxID=41978 RepID=UPI0025FF4AC0|nr:5-formyltetrahydrofolate cyclo-ligase [Ruminococcus sp.]MCI5815711.1 5-formyltetrahydrofolate cyclo-ligase [Ruminococcus sp.]